MLWGAVKLTFFVAILVAAMHFWITNKSYRFSENYVHEIAVKHASNKGSQVAHRKIDKTVQSIINDLRKDHGNHIVDSEDWVTFAQGGTTGTMKFLYLTPTEAITVMGFPVGMDGHTGRSWSNMSYTILTGHVDLWKEDEPAGVMAFHAGTNLRLLWGDAGGIRYADQTWLVSYTRGALVTSLPYGLLELVLSSCDVLGVFYVLEASVLAGSNEARLLVEELLRTGAT